MPGPRYEEKEACTNSVPGQVGVQPILAFFAKCVMFLGSGLSPTPRLVFEISPGSQALQIVQCGIGGLRVEVGGTGELEAA